ncbi:hypothetical protein VV02_16380 [Luteipulveratus mongoliensis]|uniref:Mycothiol-dependent maleylpyruvate isomerase metal-binding domain-containing protein n=1 Tax=Luteipulveratus mongoliensis TaxID=571913 RepID=A0A0K1JQK0_9MICO|nr:hypothetical protein VV02_16380 [Luteipulveratus mongoliensis]
MTDELKGRPEADLHRQAGPLTWTCFETLDHVGDCFMGYALQVTSRSPDRYLALEGIDRGVDFIHFPVELGVAGVVKALQPLSELLAAAVLIAPPDARAFHNYGVSDPAGFAAMGAVEALLHGHDVLSGLGGVPALPSDAVEVVLERLFPAVERHADGPEATLLWATGRIELSGRGRVDSEWTWDGTVHSC